MACNLPIVSVDAGDVSEVIGRCEGCHIVQRSAEAIAAKLKPILDHPLRTQGREHVRHLEMQTVARQIIEIYDAVLRRQIHIPQDRKPPFF